MVNLPPPDHPTSRTLIRARFKPGSSFPGYKRRSYWAPFKTKPKLAVFLQSDKINGSRIRGLQPDPGPGWVFIRSRKKMPKNRPPMPVLGHYMGLNSDVFWQINQFKGPDLLHGESDGYTGLFSAVFQVTALVYSRGSSGYDLPGKIAIRPVFPGCRIAPVQFVQEDKGQY